MQIESVLISNVLKLAKAYAEHAGLSTATVARYACGSHDIFDRLEAGKGSLSLNTYDRIMAYIEERWPRAEWPKSLTRSIKEPFSETR